MNCYEDNPYRMIRDQVRMDRFEHLHPDGRLLINGWFHRAWEERDCAPEESFEPFIFAWIAFNAWGACITDKDRDLEWLRALAKDEIMNDRFHSLVRNRKSVVSQCAIEFHTFWPIFKAQTLRRKQGIRGRYHPDRQSMISFYYENGIKDFEPGCSKRHREEGQPIPVDWPHTLYALYRVRCNLFHGEKSSHIESDQMIVHRAFRLLVNFLRGAGYL